jgi:hypothetical protein
LLFSDLFCNYVPNLATMKKFFTFSFLLFTSFLLKAQTVLNANYTSTSPYYFNAGGGYVTFCIQNTNAYPVVLTDLSVFQLPVYTNNAYKLWYSATSLNGTGYPIASPTWTQIAEGDPITTTTQTYVNPFKCIGFVIPAATTYRFALEGSAGYMYRSNTAPYSTTPNSFTSGGVSLQVGDFLNGGLAVGRAGISNLGLVYTNPAFFFGSVTVAPANTFTDLYISGITKPSTACNQNNSYMTATLCNRSPHTVNFAATNTTINYTVNGPNGTQNLSLALNSGTLAPCNCINNLVTGVDYSAPGTYTLTATANISSVSDLNPANNTFVDSLKNFKITLNKTLDSICQNAPPSGFNPFDGLSCMPKSGSITVNLTTNAVPPADGTSDATAGLNFANGVLPALPHNAVITGGRLKVTNLRNNTASFPSEVRFNIYGAAPNGPSNPFAPGLGGNQNSFTYYKFDYDQPLLGSQLDAMYTALGVGGAFEIGYWETLDNTIGGADIQINGQTIPTVTQLVIDYTIVPVPKWYNTPTGGSLLATNASFNPFFVTGGIPNTSTPGTHTFYAACNTDTVCRVPITINIKPSPTAVQDSMTACELVSNTGTSVFDLTTLNASVSNNLAGALVTYYYDQSLTNFINNPNNLSSPSTVVYSKVQDPTGCFSSDTVLLTVNEKPDFANSIYTQFNCAPNSVDITNLSISALPVGTDTLYFEDPAYTIPFANPTNITVTDTVYILLQTNATPSCSDSATAFVTLVPISNYISAQDTQFNYSIAGSAGCGNISFTDGITEIIRNASDCRKIVTITDIANSTSLGNVNVCQDIAASTPTHNGQPFVNRVYQITAATSDTANVCLYYLEDDFSQYNGTAMFSLPTWPLLPSMGSPTNMSNITISKVDNGDINTIGHTSVVIPNSAITATYDPLSTVWSVCFPVSGFSYFYLHAANPGNVPLPVSMLNFSARKVEHTSALNWITGSEKNNSHFIVERSKDGVNFSNLSGVIQTKAPNGNSDMPLTYAYTDVVPHYGHNYYRVKQYDLDGNTAVSTVQDVYHGEDAVVTLYPNPVSDVLSIDIQSERNTLAEIKLMDATGRTVKTISLHLMEGSNTTKIDMESLAKGIYVVQVSNGKGLQFSQTVRKN